MKMFKIAAVLLASLVVVSCSTTKLKIDGSLDEGQKDALLTGLTINLNTSSGESASLLDLAESVLAEDDLKEFGITAEENLKAFLSSKGFTQFNDEAIAKRENLPTLDLPTLGYYVHPETSNYNTNYFTGFAIGFDPAEHIAKVKGSDDVNYFIYSDISVSKANTFGIFGGYPLASFKVAVVNDMGEVVLEAKALGSGDKSFFGVDLSKENMSKALNDAIAKLNEL